MWATWRNKVQLSSYILYAYLCCHNDVLHQSTIMYFRLPTTYWKKSSHGHVITRHQDDCHSPHLLLKCLFFTNKNVFDSIIVPHLSGQQANIYIVYVVIYMRWYVVKTKYINSRFLKRKEQTIEERRWRWVDRWKEDVGREKRRLEDGRNEIWKEWKMGGWWINGGYLKKIIYSNCRVAFSRSPDHGTTSG